MDLESGRNANWNNEFGLKCSICDEDVMIHVLNNLPKEYDAIFYLLESHLTLIVNDTLIINVIREKLNHGHKKIKIKIRK